MLFLKCFGGALLGAIGGFIASIVSGLFLFIVVGLATWSGKTGEFAANFAILLFPLGVIIGIIVPIREELLKRKGLKSELVALQARSTETVVSLRDLVPEANKHLDKAEHEFKEGAFAPFWDEVENATNKLAAYHQGIYEVEHNAKVFSRRSLILSAKVPPFDIPIGDLPDARPIATRLSKVVRQAQKDFHFATIYEQRKTNQLLYAGFGTLASAIDRMRASITEALEDLSSSLNIQLDSLISVSEASLDVAECQNATLDNLQRKNEC